MPAEQGTAPTTPPAPTMPLPPAPETQAPAMAAPALPPAPNTPLELLHTPEDRDRLARKLVGALRYGSFGRGQPDQRNDDGWVQVCNVERLGCKRAIREILHTNPRFELNGGYVRATPKGKFSKR
jgi:hypothetical protein